MSTSTHEELDFVGASRKFVRDHLLECFDEVTRFRVPRWVSLEAPTGWGKTLIVHEFYKVLSARQSTPSYWPKSIVEAIHANDPARSQVDGRRKRAHPRICQAAPRRNA